MRERQRDGFTLVAPNGRNAERADLNSGDAVAVADGGTGFTVTVPDTAAIS